MAAGIRLFGWVADDPVTLAVGPLFQAMATGGLLDVNLNVSGDEYNFSNTGGGYVSGPLTDVTVAAQLQAIICDVATGGPTGVPEPATLGLLGLGLMGFAARRRRKA